MKKPNFEGKELYVGQIIVIDQVEYKITNIKKEDVILDVSIKVPLFCKVISLSRDLDEERSDDTVQYTYRDTADNLVNRVVVLDVGGKIDWDFTIGTISTRVS